MTAVTTVNAAISTVNAPSYLRALPGWLMWRYEHHEGEDKPRKIPYYASGRKRTGVQGRPEDREQLTTFEAARAAAARRGFDGVGLALMPEFDVVALDFDHCISPSGEIHPEVLNTVSDSYAEYSPSGRGIRAFFRGQLGNHKSHDGPYGFETFSSKGFVTFTGNRLEITNIMGTADTVAPTTPIVTALCRQRFTRVLDDSAAPPSAQPPLGLSEVDLESALDVLDPSLPHDDWLAVGMALHHETRGEGFDLWDRWSSLSDKYPGEEILRQRWASFGRTNTTTVTARSLVRMANAAGAHITTNGPASMEEFEAIGAQATTVADEFPTLPGQPASTKPPRFPVQTLDQFAQFSAQDYHVKGLIPKAELVVLFGESGSGKTFMALDLAAAIATGTEWRGRRVRRGRVVYIAAEGAYGMRNRVRAFADHHQLDLPTLDIGVIAASPNMMQKEDALDLARSIGPAAVVFVDTWAQVTPGANENAGEDMGKALAHCKGIHKATGATVVLIHHSGKDASKGARGWSGLRAAADTELEVIRSPGGRMMRVTKQKDGEDGLTFGFELHTVNVGMDDDGDIITSCIVAPADISISGPLRELGPVESVVNAVIQEFAVAQSAGIEVNAVINTALARIERVEGRRDTRKQRIRRAIDSLCRGDDAPYFLEDGCIGVA